MKALEAHLKGTALSRFLLHPLTPRSSCVTFNPHLIPEFYAGVDLHARSLFLVVLDHYRQTRYARNLAAHPGVARVELPDALERKYPRAAQELGWLFLFASRQLSHCPRTGRLGRHHIYPASLQRAVARAGPAAGLRRAIHCHTFRNSFATHLIERGIDVRTIQVLLGHERLETTMIYTHVARKGPAGIASPLDLLDDLTDAEVQAAVGATREGRT